MAWSRFFKRLRQSKGGHSTASSPKVTQNSSTNAQPKLAMSVNVNELLKKHYPSHRLIQGGQLQKRSNIKTKKQMNRDELAAENGVDIKMLRYMEHYGPAYPCSFWITR